jgi:hypothetical protein
MYLHVEHKYGVASADLAKLDFWFSVGNTLGAAGFLLGMSGRMSTRTTIIVGLLVGAAGMLPMLLVRDLPSGRLAYGVYGASWMIVTLSQLTVAAEACPRRVEAAVFAALMSITNVGTRFSDVVGSTLYEGRLNHDIRPLILACSAFTVAGLLLVPFLRKERGNE